MQGFESVGRQGEEEMFIGAEDGGRETDSSLLLSSIHSKSWSHDGFPELGVL